MDLRSRSAAIATLSATIGLTALALPAAAGPLQPPVLVVDDDGQYGPGCAGDDFDVFQTVQEAVDAAVVNKTKIRVCPGTYKGSVNIDDGNVDGLTIRAVKPWTATLKPASTHVAGTDLITITDVAHTELVWFNIVVPTEATCANVNIMIRVEDAPDTSLRANHIRATGTDTLGDCGYGLGISLRSSPRSSIAWNQIADFRVRGINVNGSSGVRMRGNTVRFDHAHESAVGQGNGIVLFDSPRGRILDNVVGSLSSAGDTTPILLGGIAVLSSDETLVRDNRVFWVQRGIQSVNSNDLTIGNNRVRHASIVGLRLQTIASTIQDNSAKRGDDMGIEVHASSHDNEIVGNDFRNNGGTDCVDHSSGPANTWSNNLGNESTPSGLCSNF